MKTGRILMLTVLLVTAMVLWAVPALAANYSSLPGQEVRVLLSGSSSASSYSISIGSGTYSIASISDPSRTLDTVTAGDSVTFTRNGSGGYTVTTPNGSQNGSSAFMAIPKSSDDCFVFNGTSYRGCFKAMYSGSYYYAINQINVEIYLYGVVGKELGYGLNENATKAQAVASRSYALANYSSSNTYYDLTSTTASQVYGGKSAETEQIRAAVDGTCGYVLKYNGRYVQTYYSSNMGGYSENIENVWMSDAVPIRGVPSPHDSWAYKYSSYGASTYSWTVEYTPDDLVRLANRYGGTDIGSYTGISYSDTLSGKTSVSGRAMTVTISGTKGSVTATKDNIRSLLNLKSTLIDITDNSTGSGGTYVMGKSGVATLVDDLDQLYGITSHNGIITVNGSESSFYAANKTGKSLLNKNGSNGSNIVITGKGYGHGVGFSQFGAMGMGDDGYSWQDIISHYFCGDNGIQLVDAY